MGEKLKLFILIYSCWLIASVCFSQTNVPPYIVVDVRETLNFQTNQTTNTIPIVDLINSLEVSGDPNLKTPLIYPSSVDDIDDSSTDVIVRMPFETYIKGVVLVELGGNGSEAEKSQAVASRSFAAGLAVRVPHTFTDPNGNTYSY